MTQEVQVSEVAFSQRDFGERSLITLSIMILVTKPSPLFAKFKTLKLNTSLKDTILSIQGFDSITPGYELNLVKTGHLQIVLGAEDCSPIDGETPYGKKPTPLFLSQPSQISLTKEDSPL